MANSSDVAAGQDATATQHNNLRADVLSASTGHRHSGAADGGKALLGTPVTRSGGTVYQAATDVFVMVLAVPTGADGYVRALMDANNPPTTVVMGAGYESTDEDYVSIFIVVPKGYYWKIEGSGVTISLITEVGIGA